MTVYKFEVEIEAGAYINEENVEVALFEGLVPNVQRVEAFRA